jgi:hypothetical protein
MSPPYGVLSEQKSLVLLRLLRSLALRRGFLGSLLRSCFLLLRNHEFYLQVCAERKPFRKLTKTVRREVRHPNYPFSPRLRASSNSIRTSPPQRERRMKRRRLTSPTLHNLICHHKSMLASSYLMFAQRDRFVEVITRCDRGCRCASLRIDRDDHTHSIERCNVLNRQIVTARVASSRERTTERRFRAARTHAEAIGRLKKSLSDHNFCALIKRNITRYHQMVMENSWLTRTTTDWFGLALMRTC